MINELITFLKKVFNLILTKINKVLNEIASYFIRFKNNFTNKEKENDVDFFNDN